MTILLLLALVQWQQRVSYDINATLDTQQHSLSSVERLTYYNNSPFPLDTLYLYLHANAYKDTNTYYVREAAKLGDERFVNTEPADRGFITIKSMIFNGYPLQFDVDETILRIPLEKPLVSGDSITMQIDYTLKIPKEFPRLGYWPGHYKMVEWYPKMCVFDDGGWHLDPNHPLDGSYGEFGAYDVTIDLPGDYVVAGTGTQVEPAEKEFIDRLIATGTKLDQGERKTIRFRAENVHDFAWVCDSNFMVKEYKANNTKILVFHNQQDEKSWANAGTYAVDAVSRYNEWFSRYPHAYLNIIHSHGDIGTTYPQMVILTSGEDQMTRLFESSLANEICLQWFNGIVGTNGIDEAWFGKGFATYAVIRYMEDKYGEDNSLIKTRFLPPLSLRYFHRFYYYLIQTNQLEKPVSTPPFEYHDIPISYDNSIHSKPGLFFSNLETICGREIFDAVLHEYFQNSTFKHSKVDDYIGICERQSSKNLKQLFDSFLNTTDYCDWTVKKVTANTVTVANNGGLRIPVDVHIRTENGEHIYAVDATKKSDTIIVPKESGMIKRVAIDPSENLLDPNYWNNYSPRRIRIKPIWAFKWPSYSKYQLIWSPYIWYDSYDGIIAGFYFFGDKFADFDFVRGGNQITAGLTYGSRSKRTYPSLTYQTPMLFGDGRRVRMTFNVSRSRGGDYVGFGISTKLGRPFSQRPQVGIDNMLIYHALNSYAGVDSIDWELGKNVVFSNVLRYGFRRLSVEAKLGLALHGFGSEWEYLKATIEAKQDFRVFIPFSVRLFVGQVFGTAPTHELLFLSGALRTSGLAGLIFSQSGTFSPQEHVHIPADGNMRGYQTLHIKSEGIVALNLEFPTRTVIRAFVDLGQYEEFAFDAGLRLVIGTETFPSLPLYGLSFSINFPLYSYTPGEPWKLRWSIGFSS